MKTKSSKVAISALVLAGLTGSAAFAQNTGVAPGRAQLSGDPSGRSTLGQNTTGFPNFGGAGGAGFGGQAAFGGPFNGGFNGAAGFGMRGFAGVDAFGNPVPMNGFNNGFGTGFNNGFGTGFNNGVGGNGVAGFDAFGNPVFANGFGTGFNNGLNNGFNNGFGTGFNNGFGTGFNNGFGFAAGVPFNGFGGPMWNNGWGASVPVYNQGFGQGYNPAMDVRANAMSAMPGGRIAGVNAPPLRSNVFRPAAPGARRLVRTDPKTPEDVDRARRIRVEEDVAGSREEFRGNTDADLGTSYEDPEGAGMTGVPGAPSDREVRQAPATPDQISLARKVERLMAERPMREGLVTRLNSKTVEVRYECKGETRTESFPSDEVFYFRSTGELSTAAKAAGQLDVGDRVLVACREENTPRQGVAGSREESRSGHQGHTGMRNNATPGTNGNGSIRNANPSGTGTGTNRTRPSRQNRGRVNSLGEK